ncbi:MAG TPA: hypothetical protein VEW05_16595 [Candidatus Polarisedimenticolia bacterium]|nr:hypothetical protein [Candidatus Polarisedimenticolia bacterium]
MNPVELPEARVTEIISGVAAYLRRERELYFRASEPLDPGWRAAVQDYFSDALLGSIKTIILKGARIPPPPFYAEAMAFRRQGYDSPVPTWERKAPSACGEAPGAGGVRRSLAEFLAATSKIVQLTGKSP